MRRLGIIVLGIVVLALAGCIPGLDDIIGPIDGGASGPSYVLVEYQISTTVVRSDTGDESKFLFASIGSLGTVYYDADLHIVSCDAQVGDLQVQMEIHLNAAEDMIDYIYVRRINTRLFGAWWRYDLLESYSVASATIPYNRTEDGNKIFRIDQSTFYDFCDSIEVVDWREWRSDFALFGETIDAPLYWVKDPLSTAFHDCADSGNYVEVTLEYD